MLTKEQEEWVNHLSDTGSVKIAPYDPAAPAKFEAMKKRILSALGGECEVLHRGASGLGISGQPEIDIYIPVTPAAFDGTVALMEKAFGKPYSVYLQERTKFILSENGTKFEIMVVNADRTSWAENVAFFAYLKDHPEDLDRYRRLKEEAAGLSNREYYRRKIEFINGILSKSSDIVRPSA